ncbi:MAG: MoxR family ATPase [Polyangiales bacterium]
MTPDEAATDPKPAAHPKPAADPEMAARLKLAARLDDRSDLPEPNEGSSRWREARLYLPDDELREALRVAVILGRPLLLTGDPGSGKTTAAYWAAQRMGLRWGDFISETVRSDATAARLRYEFDAVRYFRDAQASVAQPGAWKGDRSEYLRHGPLWKAFEGARRAPTALLLDEIDKAPRDLPNDLLEEFDAYRFEVPELPEDHADRVIDARASGANGSVALVVFTSNGERQLPDAFLRRCVHHHVGFNRELLVKIFERRIAAGDLKLDRGLVDLALDRFAQLQQLNGLRHRPGLAELLLWARMIGLTEGIGHSKLQGVRLGELPYLGTLIKDAKDRTLVGAV